MVSAVNNGSGSRAKVIGVEIAGKPELLKCLSRAVMAMIGLFRLSVLDQLQIRRLQYWLFCISQRPKFVMVEWIAAPVFQTVAEQVLDYLNVPRQQSAAQNSGMTVVPNVRNYPTAEAERILKEHKLTANYLNNGEIVMIRFRPGRQWCCRILQ